MTVRVLTTSSSEETEQLGAELARELHPGDVVLVAGELGAGKTTLVRGASRALGVVSGVTSPTFTIGQRYRGENVLVSHLDVYRITALDAEDPDLLADYLRPDAIAFVEWPPETDDALGGLGRIAMRVTLEHGGGDRRTIMIAAGPAGGD